MRQTALLLAAVATLGLAGATLAQGNYAGAVPAPPLPIVDPAGCAVAGPVTATTITVPDSFTITDVNVNLGLTHTWYGDLRIEIEHLGTTVVMLTQATPDDSSDLGGVYTIDDEAAGTFDAAATAVPGATIIAPGSYIGDNPLAAFDGMDAAGAWNLTITDWCGGDPGTLDSLSIDIAGPAIYGGPIAPVAITYTGPTIGICNPADLITLTVTVPDPGTVTDVDLRLGLTHTWFGDLDVAISHCGVTVVLMDGTPDDSSDLGGLYTFSDEAAGTFDAAALAAGALIAPGSYVGDNALAAFDGMPMGGDWTITICDTWSGDNGFVDHVALLFTSGAPASWGLTIAQPAGPGSDLYIDNVGGTPGNDYLNIMTQNAGAFPFGWAFGVDIPVADLIAEIVWGDPFFGTLNDCGEKHQVVAAPIPSGITAYIVALELSGGIPVSVTAPFIYVTP